jgi:CRISPR-associated endoribonuclease Cas6
MPVDAAIPNNPSPDLISLVLQLKPIDDTQSNSPHHFWGYAAYSMLLNHLQQIKPELSEQIHDTQQPAPLTTSNLMGYMQAGKLISENSYRLRITAYNPLVSTSLLQLVQSSGSLAVGNKIELDYTHFSIENVYTTSAQDQWAGLSSYQALSQSSLMDTRPERRIQLKIFTPAIFKHNQQLLPFPLPSIVVHNLLEKWNQHAPIKLPEEVKRYADKCLVISKYELKTRIASLPNQIKRPGVIGNITYSTTNYDRYWMSMVQTLMRFAFYAGIGKHTSLGLGQVRYFSNHE